MSNELCVNIRLSHIVARYKTIISNIILDRSYTKRAYASARSVPRQKDRFRACLRESIVTCLLYFFELPQKPLFDK